MLFYAIVGHNLVLYESNPNNLNIFGLNLKIIFEGVSKKSAITNNY